MIAELGIDLALCRSCEAVMTPAKGGGLCEDCAHQKEWAAHWRAKVADARRDSEPPQDAESRRVRRAARRASG